MSRVKPRSDMKSKPTHGTFELGGEVIEFNVREETSINALDLVGELLTQTAQYADWAKRYEDSTAVKLMAEHDVEVVYAQADEALRKEAEAMRQANVPGFKTPTEPQLKQLITASAPYRDAKIHAIEMKKQSGYAKVMADAFRMRADMLKLLCGRKEELDVYLAQTRKELTQRN